MSSTLPLPQRLRRLLPDRALRVIAPLANRLEVSIVAALLVCAGGLWGFVQLADEIGEDEVHAADTAILLAFRQTGQPDNPIGPWWLEVAFGDLTSLGSMSVLALMTAAVLGYLALMRRFGAAVFVLVAVAGGAALSSLLKIGIDRPRPDLVAKLADVHTLSFPSGHAMLAAATYLTLGVMLAEIVPDRRLRLYVLSVAVALTLIVGISRVYLGVHWPTDVLAGWCAGAAWAMICWLASRLFRQRLTAAP